ncbi:MAG: alkaline phosphatase family protein [bacterium]|nr:alkaline phosphatase family protein [bacterium]
MGRQLATLRGTLAFSFLSALALTGSAAGEPAALVVWLSLDGVRHDQPDLGSFPALDRVAREGVRAAGLRPVFPSSTFPNHVSLATCARADRHGVVGNRFRDRDRGLFDYENDASWIDAEPIWASAERQGVRSAVFFWVGSETPWRDVAATDLRTPFDSDVSEREKVDQILAWIDRPASRRPGLVLAWWHGTDRAGHAGGPSDPGIADDLARQDAELGRLLEGLDTRDAWSFTTLFVSSDHGMTRADQAIDAAGILRDAGIEAEVISGAAVAFVTLADPGQGDRAAHVLRQQSGHRVYGSSEIPDAFRIRRPRRIGDLLLVAEPPFYYPRQGWLAWLQERWLRWRGGVRGAHGYDPEHRDMAGIFFAMGRGVAPDLELGTVSNLDLAPTASRLLGIAPPADCEGRAIDGISGAPQ